MLPVQLGGEVVQHPLHHCELQQEEGARTRASFAGLVEGPTPTGQGGVCEDLDVMRGRKP